MRYLGGKYRLARKIVAEILRAAPETQGFCEPFMGGGAVTLELAKHRPTLAGDAGPGLLDLYRLVCTGWRVPAAGVSDSEYRFLRNNLRGSGLAVVAAVGFGLSFGGKFFDGLARPSACYASQFNNWADRFCAQSGIHLRPEATVDYTNWRQYAQPGVTFYADPPYAATEGYALAGAWDAKTFFAEARLWRACGARVFISEFSAPFRCVAEFTRTVEVDNASGKPRKTCVDRLFEVDP